MDIGIVMWTVMGIVVGIVLILVINKIFRKYRLPGNFRLLQCTTSETKTGFLLIEVFKK